MAKLLIFLLKLAGWKIDKSPPEGIKKCVIVVGPHTSNWDFIIGKIVFSNYPVKAKFLIKKELFFFPLGFILRRMGALPVDRKKKNSMIHTAVRLFAEHESMYLVFTPEGTRSYNPKWKKGFYYIAQKANVPIVISYMDYERKIGGFHSVFTPTGDVDADFSAIKGVLKNYKGKFPENGID
jgi:1-acyl-sn-glycerol-3-phosphate acyltransferase